MTWRLFAAGATAILSGSCHAAAEGAQADTDEDRSGSGNSGAGTRQGTAISSDSSVDHIFAAIFGATPPPAPTLDYPVQLIGMNRGDIRVTPGPSPAATMIDRRAIVDMLLPLLNQEQQSELLRTFTDQAEVSAAELTGLGYTTQFDEYDFVLKVDVPLVYRSIVPIPLQQRHSYEPATGLVRQATTSAIVNVFAGTSYIYDSTERETGFNSTEANIEAAFNYRGAVLETGLRYSDMAESPLARADTRLTYDFVDRTIRTEAGDLSAPTAGLQGNPGIGGISAYREFRLQPDVNFRANPSQQFELQRDARVSVFINGQYVRELRLVSGRYSLTDLPLRSGAGNDVTLEIQYDTGEIERVVFSAFYDFELLKKGTSEFAFSAGPTSETIENERRYDTDNIAFSGLYRLGVSDRLTVGGNSQFDSDLVNVGAEAVYATAIGAVGGSGAYSDHASGAGTAATLFYRWNAKDTARPISANVQARYQDREYRRLGSSAGAPFKYDAAARLSATLTPKSRIQASAGYRQFYGAKPDEYSASVSGSRDIGRGSLSASISYLDAANKPEWFFGVSYSLRFGNAAIQVAHDSRDETTRASASYQPDPSVGSLGYDVAYTRQPDLQELRAGVGYIGNRFDGRIEQSAREGVESREHFTNLFLGSALVYADQKFALSRPVFDSFAMFGPKPGAGDFDLSVDPVGGLFGKQTGYAATSSMFGAAVLTDLQSYYNRTVSVEAPKAPAGTSLGENVFSFKPGYRSGYKVEVGSEFNVSIMGRLVGPDGEPVKFASGYAVSEDGERTPVFSNAGGRFYVEQLKSGQTLRIEFNNPKGAWVELKIPKDSLGVIRLKQDVVLNMAPKAAPPRIANLSIEKGS